ncbi:MAG: AsmA family protein [Chromatiales bacterium]|jgi:AsmA protein
MGRLLKILAWIIGVLVVLVIAVALIVRLVIDPNDYKDRITSAVKEATGRTLSIGGDIDLSLFPWLGVELNRLELSNAQGFGDAPFAAVESADVRVKLLPLLSKRVEVGKVVLDGLRLNLAKAQDGRTNWQDLTEPGPEGAAAEEAPAADRAGPGIDALTVSGIELRDAGISWTDRATGQSYAVERLNVQTGSIRPGEPVDLDLSMQVQSEQPRLEGKVVLAGRVEISEDMGRLSVSPMELRLEDFEGEDGLEASARLTGDLSFDTAAGRLEIPGIEMVLDAEGGPIEGDGLHAELDAALVMDTRAGDLSVEGLRLTAGELSVTGAVRLKGLQSERPQLAGALKVAELDLRRWLEAQGIPLPEMSDETALSRFSLEADLGSRGEEVGVERLAVRLDDTSATGNLWMRNPDSPAFRFALDVDRIDLDRYMPPPAEEIAAAPAAAPGSADEDTEVFPVDTLRALDLNGTLSIGSLTARGVKAGQIEIEVKAGGGGLQIDQRVGRLYEGSSTSQVKVNVSGGLPQLVLSQSLAEVQASPLLLDLTGQDRIDGTARLTANLTSRGNTVGALRAAMQGNLDFRFEDGAIKGVNIAKLIRDAQARLNGQPVPKTGEPQKTDFTLLEGNATVQGNLVNNTYLELKSPLLRVEGTGTADLEKEFLDYRVKTTLVKTLEGQGGKGLKDLTGIPIPVRYQGRFDEIGTIGNWSIDLQDAAVQAGKQKLQEKLQEKLLERLGGGKPSAPAPESEAPAEAGSETPAEPPSQKDAVKGLLKRGLGL